MEDSMNLRYGKDLMHMVKYDDDDDELMIV